MPARRSTGTSPDQLWPGRASACADRRDDPARRRGGPRHRPRVPAAIPWVSCASSSATLPASWICATRRRSCPTTRTNPRPWSTRTWQMPSAVSGTWPPLMRRTRVRPDGRAASRSPTSATGSQWSRLTRRITAVTGRPAGSCSPRSPHPPSLLDRFAGVVRGRIALAQDHVEEALTDATAYILYATDTGGDEDFYYGEALEARCHHAQGADAEALATTERFLTRWHDSGGFTARALELCELAPILVRHAATKTSAAQPSCCPKRAAGDTPCSSPPTSGTPTPPCSTPRSAAAPSPPTHICSPPTGIDEGRLQKPPNMHRPSSPSRNRLMPRSTRGSLDVCRSCVVVDNPLLWSGGRGSSILSSRFCVHVG